MRQESIPDKDGAVSSAPAVSQSKSEIDGPGQSRPAARPAPENKVDVRGNEFNGPVRIEPGGQAPVDDCRVERERADKMLSEYFGKPEHDRKVMGTLLVDAHERAVNQCATNGRIHEDVKRTLQRVREMLGDPVSSLSDFEHELTTLSFLLHSSPLASERIESR